MESSPEREALPPIPADRPAVFAEAGFHDFVPSEFAPESGRCDRCGGGQLAQIHQKPVDQMARIADALGRGVNQMERIAVALESITDLLDGWDKARDAAASASEWATIRI